MVAVGDQERRVDRQLARGDRPHARPHTPLLRFDGRLAAWPAEDGVGVIEQEDRLELRARRTQEAQPPLLRARVRPFVRQHLPLLVRGHRHRSRHSLAGARDAVGADVLLRDPPVRLVAAHERAARAPVLEVAGRLLGGVGERQVHDVVRAAREVLAALLVRDHVVRWRDERVERAGDRRVVAERAERPDRGHSCRLERVVRTLTQAARWLDRVGLALLFPKTDVVLPSLWEQVNGDAARNWAVRDAEGGFVEWTEEMGFLWGAKDELPAQGLACVGKHVARVATCVAPRLVPTLVAAAAPYEPDGLEAQVTDAITRDGPMTGPELRDAVGAPKKDVDKAVAMLHRRLVLTNSHLVEQDGPWGAIAHDLLARKWKVPKRLPSRERARRELATVFLATAGELTAADLAPVGWRRKEAAAVLDEVADGRDADGFRIWARR